MDLNQLKQLQSKLRQLNQAKIEQWFADEIISNKDEIVELVRQRWREGKRPDGGIIGEYRSFAYEMEKIQRNPLAGGNVDLIDTHRLERELTVNYLRGSLFNIFSTDEKAVSIAEKYGLDVYGLTNDEIKDVLFEAGQRVYKKGFEYLGI